MSSDFIIIVSVSILQCIMMVHNGILSLFTKIVVDALYNNNHAIILLLCTIVRCLLYYLLYFFAMFM